MFDIYQASIDAIPLFFRNGSRKFVTRKVGTQSPMEREWQEWAGTQDSPCLPARGQAQGPTTRCLSHAALPGRPAGRSRANIDMRENCIRSRQDHFKMSQRLQSNPFLQITVSRV